MLCEIKLKTGFFERSSYQMDADNMNLIISSRDRSPEEQILISLKDLIAFNIICPVEKKMRFEIHTKSKVYIGSFNENTQRDVVFQYLGKYLERKLKIENGGFV